MGKLIDGKWEQASIITSDKTGHFVRADSVFRNWITADGKSGFKAEAGRYHLYISYACPWACRTLIMRKLKGLEKVISYSAVDALMLENGWTFGAESKETADKINQTKYLHEIYVKADPHYTGKVTVPVLWDTVQKTIVSNESADIIRMLNSEFNAYAEKQQDFYPEALREDIDTINAFVYSNINNGVYKCGFAQTQESYEEAFDELFNALNKLEERLATQQFLGDSHYLKPLEAPFESYRCATNELEILGVLLETRIRF